MNTGLAEIKVQLLHKTLHDDLGLRYSNIQSTCSDLNYIISDFGLLLDLNIEGARPDCAMLLYSKQMISQYSSALPALEYLWHNFDLVLCNQWLSSSTNSFSCRYECCQRCLGRAIRKTSGCKPYKPFSNWR